MEDLIALQQLEQLLHTNAVRNNKAQLEALLHPEFLEIGRSGRIYNRLEIINEFSNDHELPPIKAEDFQLALLSEHVVLITYKTMHVDPNGEVHRKTARSSTWVKEDGSWRLRFHQGTSLD